MQPRTSDVLDYLFATGFLVVRVYTFQAAPSSRQCFLLEPGGQDYTGASSYDDSLPVRQEG